jgi:site-specific DNA-methyltransferase (adenine-specific)
MIDLIKGDCLIESDKIESGSVDLILTDLPYGTVKGLSNDSNIKHGMKGKTEWDSIIDTDKVMNIANRILRKNGKMILTSQQPFTNELINKALPNLPFNYSMIWEKDHFANALTAKKAPLNYYEDVLVFSKNERNLLQDYKGLHPLREYFYTEYEKTGLTYKEINRDYLGTAFEGGGGMAYNMLCRTRTSFFMPIEERYLRLQKTGLFKKSYNELKTIHEKYHNKLKTDLYNKYPSTFNLWEGKKTKSNILKYKKDYTGHHPTQKPLLLLEDLIKTFSNENDLIVDLTMGSGSTGVACVNTNRSFIGIEMDSNYFEIAKTRIL